MIRKTSFGAGGKLKDFRNAVDNNSTYTSEIDALRKEVEDFAKEFPTIGFEKADMKYTD